MRENPSAAVEKAFAKFTVLCNLRKEVESTTPCSAELLKNYLNRYPEFAESLIRFWLQLHN